MTRGILKGLGEQLRRLYAAFTTEDVTDRLRCTIERLQR
jgi:hypothetical protein